MEHDLRQESFKKGVSKYVLVTKVAKVQVTTTHLVEIDKMEIVKKAFWKSFIKARHHSEVATLPFYNY